MADPRNTIVTNKRAELANQLRHASVLELEIAEKLLKNDETQLLNKSQKNDNNKITQR